MLAKYLFSRPQVFLEDRFVMLPALQGLPCWPLLSVIFKIIRVNFPVSMCNDAINYLNSKYLNFINYLHILLLHFLLILKLCLQETLM